DLDLMQAEAAAGTGDQHGLPRLKRGYAQGRTDAGADRTDRKRGRRHVETVGNADGVACGHASEFGVASPTLLAQHAAVAAEVLAAGKAIAAAAAEQALIDHHPLADARGHHIGARSDDLARDLMAEDATGSAARNLAAARKHIVVADARGMDAHQ